MAAVESGLCFELRERHVRGGMGLEWMWCGGWEGGLSCVVIDVGVVGKAPRRDGGLLGWFE